MEKEQRNSGPILQVGWRQKRQSWEVNEYELSRGSGGDHGLSNSHEGVRKMVWHAEMWSPIPLSHLIKYDFFSSAVPGPFQVLGQHRLVYNGRVKSLRKRYSKSQTSCIFLQNPTNLPKPFFTFFLHTPHWDCYKTKFCHCQHQKKMQNCMHMARLGGAGGWSVNSRAGVASVGRGWGCPDNSPFAGQNQAHQQSLWCLWENVFMKGQKTVETERAEKGTKKKRVRNTRANTKAKEEEMLHGRADNPKRTAAHGGPMPEQRGRVRRKAAERNCYVTNINPPCQLLPEWRDWVLTVVIISKEERSQEWRTEAEPGNGGGRMFSLVCRHLFLFFFLTQYPNQYSIIYINWQ